MSNLSPVTAASLEMGGDAKDQVYRTEFHQFYAEFITQDLATWIQKYPLISVITMVASTFFGLLTLFSFSLSNMISGGLLLALGGSIAKSIKWNDTPIWNNLLASTMDLFKWVPSKAK